MPIAVDEFLKVLERLAPPSMAEEWDNCGLQVGLSDHESSEVLVSLNVDDAVIDEAVASGCGLILTHHPLIFQPLSAVSDASASGRLAQRAAAAGIAIVAAHTNLDAAPGGLADVMAGLIDLSAVETIAAQSRGTLFKLVVFVPPGDLDAVREALFAAGAGRIGDYRHCSWYAGGTGTFQPLQGAHPTVGRVGNDEAVEEVRLETLVDGDDLEPAVAAMLTAHSYEEPAYDIYPLVTLKQGAPAGRVGTLPVAAEAESLAREIATAFGSPQLRFTDPGRLLRRIAVVPGSGAGFISTLVGKADALVTGDFKYHDSQQAAAAGIGLIELPHDISEAVALRKWLPRLERELAGTGVRLRMSSVATNAWETATAENVGAPILEKTMASGIYRLHVDGGARGNPGPAAIGAVLFDDDDGKVAELSETIGKATNNVAEYQALIAGVGLAVSRGVTSLDVFSDSELIIKQLQGSYKVKNEGLKPLHARALSVLSGLESYRLFAVPREENAHADALVNQALDDAG